MHGHLLLTLVNSLAQIRVVWASFDEVRAVDLVKVPYSTEFPAIAWYRLIFKEEEEYNLVK